MARASRYSYSLTFGQRSRDERGYAMAALLVAIAIMSIAMGAALPVWHTQAKREREEEYVFRARQYARAVALFQRKYANAFPPNVDVLVNERFLRKKYKDPLADDDFELVRVGSPLVGQPTAPVTGRPGGPGRQGSPNRAGGPGPGATGRIGEQQSALGQARIGQAGGGGGIMGVTSKSKEKSLRLLNGRDTYDQWVILGTEASLFGGRGAAGSQAPGVPGGRGANAPGTGTRGGQPPGARGGTGSRGGFPSPGRP
jgi:type II secretory pathway pseudopilin PulG